MSLDSRNKEQEATLDVLPQCWNDRRLLEHDPLKRVFSMLLELERLGQDINLSAVIKQNIRNDNDDTFVSMFVSNELMQILMMLIDISAIHSARRSSAGAW